MGYVVTVSVLLHRWLETIPIFSDLTYLTCAGTNKRAVKCNEKSTPPIRNTRLVHMFRPSSSPIAELDGRFTIYLLVADDFEIF